ncbi:MAG: hypothetical protein GX661_06030, partial [Acholeplasmataceae bacterium]|nr:hypothetical protein [Acholeplasmataceae bacterium]
MKILKKKPSLLVLLIVIVVISVVIIGWLGSDSDFNDFLEDLFNIGRDQDTDTDPDTNPPVTRPYEQDENGFYYYSFTGYESGDYYYSAKNLTGEALADQLHLIINTGMNKISYGDARYVLAYSDRDPNNIYESVRGIYDNDVIATEWIGEGEGAWQREHVWPNSKLGT